MQVKRGANEKEQQTNIQRKVKENEEATRSQDPKNQTTGEGRGKVQIQIGLFLNKW